MQRLIARATVAVALLVTAACTQSPAAVELKGQNNYTRSLDAGYGDVSRSAPSSSSYSSYTPPSGIYTNHPVSQDTSNTAGVQSIGVSDLPPPTNTKAAAKPTMQQHSANDPQVVNAWTGKPHDTAQVQPAKVEHVADSKPVAKPKPLTVAHNQSFIWPVNGKKVISGFGSKGPGKANDGINIAAAEGEPVWAAADGEVVYVGDGVNGYGNMVLIKHSGDKTTSYAHLSRATVDKYDRVKQGDIIGYVGTTGNVKDPQLHFAVNDGKIAVDPKKFLPTSMASN